MVEHAIKELTLLRSSKISLKKSSISPFATLAMLYMLSQA